MNNKTVKTTEFIAVDSDGNKHRIVEFTLLVGVTSDGVSSFIPGNKVYQLQNGCPVNSLGNGGFEIVETGVVLKRSTA